MTMVILAILIALATGALRRYRATVVLRTTVEHLVNDLQTTTKHLAQASNCPNLNASPTAAQAAILGQPYVVRLMKKAQGSVVEVKQEWLVGDEAGSTYTLSFESPDNLGCLNFTAVDSQGVALVICQKDATGYRQLFCVPLEPDGTLYANTAANTTPDTLTGSFVVNNTYSRTRIEVSPLGKVKVTDNI